MKAPRYLLREYAVKDVLRTIEPCRFLEVGYGGGEMLLTLEEMGYWGTGYDISPAAYATASAVLARKSRGNVSLVTELDPSEVFDCILAFEVIGYWEDPVAELRALRRLLAEDGNIVFSFTNKKHCGAAERLTGNMQCFTREEIKALAGQADLNLRYIWNYGYPLSNIFRPLVHAFFALRGLLGKGGASKADVLTSGLSSQTFRVFRPAQLLVNPVTMWPFAKLQMPFKHSDLGTGYIAVATK